jgi:hypothetical protein
MGKLTAWILVRCVYPDPVLAVQVRRDAEKEKQDGEA